jgi:hypothetical protein
MKNKKKNKKHWNQKKYFVIKSLEVGSVSQEKKE